jgi:putative cardiolipin synthase
MKALKVVSLSVAALVVCSCAQLPKDYEAEPTTAFTDTTVTALGLRSISVRQTDPDMNRVIPMIDGIDAFYARGVLARSAERSLDLQYFLWHKDVTGQVLLKLVLDAADRGVRVRMLLDDLYNQALNPEFYALDTHPNISIRLFNPFATRGFKYVDFFIDTARINRRMHNKSFTADNQYTMVGGRNIGDEYFDALEDTNFYDLDLLVTGPLVEQVSNQFDIYWNHETVVPIYAFDHNTATAADLKNVRVSLAEFAKSKEDSRYADDVKASEITAVLKGEKYPAYTGTGDVIFDDPDKGLGKPPDEFASMKDLIRPHFQNVKRDVILISPYFVPRDQIVESMIAKVKDGVSVSVITNS